MNRPGAHDVHYWIVECFYPNEKRNAAYAYECAKVDDVIEIINNSLGREQSGVTEVEISFVERSQSTVENLVGDVVRITPTSKLIRFKRFSNLNDAMSTLKLWSVFS